MPNFGLAQSGGNSNPSLNLTALYPGDGPYLLFAGENPAAPQASVVIERGKQGSDDAGISFSMVFAAPPTAVVLILGTNTPNALLNFNPNQWLVLYNSTDKQVDGYTDTGRWRFYCAYIASQSAGGNLTVSAQR